MPGDRPPRLPAGQGRHAAGTWRIGFRRFWLLQQQVETILSLLPFNHTNSKGPASCPKFSTHPPHPTAPRCAWRQPMPASPLDAVVVDTATTRRTHQGQSAGQDPCADHRRRARRCSTAGPSRNISTGISGNELFPRNPAKRTEAERLEALADGICDCLLAHVYERRSRPEENGPSALARQAMGQGCVRALDHLNAAPPEARQEDDSGTHRAARDARLPRSAVCGEMGKGARQAQALGRAFRRKVSRT